VFRALVGVQDGDGAVGFLVVVSVMVVTHHRMAVSVSEAQMEWEFGPDWEGPLPMDGPETVPFVQAIERVVEKTSLGGAVVVEERWKK
jgi:hypothetical protein